MNKAASEQLVREVIMINDERSKIAPLLRNEQRILAWLLISQECECPVPALESALIRIQPEYRQIKVLFDSQHLDLILSALQDRVELFTKLAKREPRQR